MKYLAVAFIALCPAIASAQSAQEMIERQIGAQAISLAQCTAGSNELQKQIATLNAKLTEVTKERDDAKAKAPAPRMPVAAPAPVEPKGE